MATFDKIKDIIIDNLDVEEEEIKLETKLNEDLEADSLDLFQIINDIEDEFDIEIDTEEDMETVEDVVKYVDAKAND